MEALLWRLVLAFGWISSSFLRFAWQLRRSGNSLASHSARNSLHIPKICLAAPLVRLLAGLSFAWAYPNITKLAQPEKRG